MGEHRILGCKVHTWSKYLSWVFIVAHSTLLCIEAIEGYELWQGRPVELALAPATHKLNGCNNATGVSDSSEGYNFWKTRVFFLGLQTIENILELIMSIILLLGAMMRARPYLKSWVIFASLIIFWHVILTIIRESILGDNINEVMGNFAELIFIVSLYGFVMWIVGILVHEITLAQRRARNSGKQQQQQSLKV